MSRGQKPTWYSLKVTDHQKKKQKMMPVLLQRKTQVSLVLTECYKVN